MNAHIGKSTGIALLMAAALLAALFAMGVFAPGGVSADAPTFTNFNSDLTPDTAGNDIYEWVIPENSTDMTFDLVSVTHENGNVAYSIDTDAQAAFFSISAGTGLLRYSGSGYNFEGLADATADLGGSQAIVITVTAAHGDADATASVHVTITNVQDKPTFVGASDGTALVANPTGTITENSDMARSVVTVYAIDVDSDNEDITFDLDQASKDLGFSLGEATGGSGRGTGGTPAATAQMVTVSYQRPDGADKLNYEDYDTPAEAIKLMVTAMSGSESAMQEVVVGLTDQTGEKPGKPDAPMLSYVVNTAAMKATGKELSVSWDQPANEGPQIFQYILEYKKESDPDTSASWKSDNVYDDDGMISIDRTDGAVQGSTDPVPGAGTNYLGQQDGTENLLNGLSATVKGLDSGVEYVARVRAYNLEGTAALMSDYSDASDALAPTVSPSEPTGLMLTAGDGSLSASWTAPEMDGGLELTYKVMWRTIGQDEATGFVESGISGTTFDIPNLMNGTRYTVTVRAVNAIGESDSSDGKSATPMAATMLPSIPMNLALENPTTTSVLARWNPPASDGGSSVTGYQVQYMLGSGAFMMMDDAAATATSQLISFDSATSSRTITVQVRAMNSEGNGPWDTSRTSIPAAAVVPTALNNTLPKTFDATKSSSPGATVRVELKAMLAKGLGQGIVIKLDKFGLPSSISKSDVTIESNDGLNYFDGNPRDVAVGSNTVTLYLGTLDGPGDATMRTLDSTKLTTITIQQTAGITHPNVAGDYTVQIDGKDSVNQATVVREISVKPASAARDEEITVTGKGFASGDAQVYIDNSKNKDMDDANVGEPVGITDGSFELVTTVGSGFNAGMNTINATDSAGIPAGTGATFTLKPKITVSPDEVAIAQKLTITLSDWSHGRVTAVRFAGGDRMTVSSADSTFDSGDDTGKVEVIVPDGTRRGKVNVYLYVDSDGTAEGTAVATIATLDLSVSPSSVVPGQRVTINGSDFAQLKTNEKITVTIGGKAATVPSDAGVTSTGRVSVTVAVPLNVGTGDKTVALKAGAITGNGEVTVAKPSITVSPEESLPGTIVSVSGSGFGSGERLEVLYDGVFEETGRADTNGNFSLRLQIPSDAGIGTTNKVKVQVRNQLSINASADHKTPGAMITLPAQAQSGSTITITGGNFAPFSVLSKVTIGTQNAMPSPAPETDKNGSFSFQARVPRLGVGSHNVTVQDGATPKNTATETFTVTDTPIISAPAEVFGVLGDKLVVVWRYDNATATWASYSPGGPAEINDLTGLSSGEIVWIQVTENVADFQGSPLYAGWNLITLE